MIYVYIIDDLGVYMGLMIYVFIIGDLGGYMGL